MKYLLKRGNVYLVNFTYGRSSYEGKLLHGRPGYESTTNVNRATRFSRYAAHLISALLPAVEVAGGWELVQVPN